MKVALFLGAGASVPFEKPITTDMKFKMYDKCDQTKEGNFLRSFLNCHHFTDIEHVLQSLSDLQSLWSNYGGKYFQAGNTDLVVKSKIDEMNFADFIINVKESEKTIIKEVYLNYSWDHRHDEKLRQIYDEIFSKLALNFDEIRVATTNYDKAIEIYCSLERSKYYYSSGFKRDELTGFRVWTGTFSDSTIVSERNNLTLYKLHGSLNWKKHMKYDFVETDEESISPDPKFVENLVIHPTVSPKDGTEREPFVSVRKEFESYMDEADACFVIGFSFRDEHVNQIFKKFVESKKPLVVLSPSSMENVCQNLLKVSMPENYSKTRISSMVPVDGDVWCIPYPLHENQIRNHMEVVCSHLARK